MEKCIFGYGKCRVLKSILEISKESSLPLKILSGIKEIPSTEEEEIVLKLTEAMKKYLPHLLASTTAPIVSQYSTVAYFDVLSKFCSICPKRLKRVRQ